MTDLKEELIEFVKRKKLKLILGKLDFQNLNNLYKEYKIFISNSLFEGNPKTILKQWQMMLHILQIFRVIKKQLMMG